MAAELTQEKGRIFVIDKTKAYLEGTCKILVPSVVYDGYGETDAVLLDGEVYRYDLKAHFRGSRIPIWVECKDYEGMGDLGQQYNQFIVKSYSFLMTLKKRDSLIHSPYFMFAASRPYHCTRFDEIVTPAWVRAQIEAAATAKQAGIEVVDDNVLAEFVNHLWVVIWSNRQELFCIKNPDLVASMVVDKVGGDDW